MRVSFIGSAACLVSLCACASEPAVESRPPSYLYPIVSPLVGGNDWGTAHATDYDIARDPNEVPALPLAEGARVTFATHELRSFVAPRDPSLDPPRWSGPADVPMAYMAYSATTDDPSIASGSWSARVPGPFLKVVANRSLEIVLENPVENGEAHSIDFHAVVGARGGAAMLVAEPGRTARMTIRPTHPGLFVYHCAEDGTPGGIAEHMNGGMYGLILVLPGDADGNLDDGAAFNQMLAAGVSEHYVFEQDVYLDAEGRYDEIGEGERAYPDVVTYNGRVSALVDHPLVGSLAHGSYVIYHGAGGVHVPTFHVIGAVFDDVWVDGDLLSPPGHSLQTVLIPSAGTAVVRIDPSNLIVNVPGDYVLLPELDILVDHETPYFRRGALGFMEVTR